MHYYVCAATLQPSMNVDWYGIVFFDCFICSDEMYVKETVQWFTTSRAVTAVEEVLRLSEFKECSANEGK